jgi:benzylsuccinate CoA-transferase BbsF subunit
MNIAPLKGIRIVSLTWVWAGPWMGAMLADMGAEVIKVETRQRLDAQRIVKLTKDSVEDLNMGQFNFTNRGIKSCTINMKEPEGIETFKKLVAVCDAVITNFAPRVLPGWGLGYDELKKIKPDLIMVTLPAFGSIGPDKDYVSYASTIEAVGGLNISFGYPGEPPVLSGTYPADPVGGVYGVAAFMAALIYRNETGKGQLVDVAQSEGVTSLIPEVIMEQVMNGRTRPRMGNRDDIMAPHGCYPCKGEDKWVAIAVGTDEEWKAMCKVMGKPDWCKDEKFVDQYSRWKNQDELNRLVAEWTKNYTHYEAQNLLQKAGVAAGSSLDIGELVNDPHVVKRGAIFQQNHKVAGEINIYRSPWKSALTEKNRPAPLLGEDNDYVFKKLLGMSDGEIARLTEKKVIY